jgi:RNAse (barnase) inhibitor barstar
MRKYDAILRGGRCGIYAAPPLVGPLRAAAKRVSISWYELDLKGAADREALLRRCAAVFALPPYFGNNWDALHESLLDIAGRGTPGAIVHWRRGAELARRAPDAVTTAFRVLEDVAAYWGLGGRTFLVIVDRDSARGRALRPLR